MNRDEARARGPEIPPAMHEEQDGTTWIAPADSEKGGTWFGLNHHGLAACLLNRYQDRQPAPPDHPASRGAIVPALMQTRTVPEAQERLESGALPLDAFPPFTVLLTDLEHGVRLDWRGAGSVEVGVLETPWHMVTSSFFDPGHVLPWRKAAFDRWLASGAAVEGTIPVFHLSQPPGAESIAPMMARDISCTRSITQICLDRDAGTGTMRYAPVNGATMDRTTFAQPHVLRLCLAQTS